MKFNTYLFPTVKVYDLKFKLVHVHIPIYLYDIMILFLFKGKNDIPVTFYTGSFCNIYIKEMRNYIIRNV